MKEAFKEIKLSAEKLTLISICNRIIKGLRDQGHTLTLRQLYYQMIAGDHLPSTWIDDAYNRRNGLPDGTKNTEKNYKRLGALLGDARLAGLVDWEAIEDRTRSLDGTAHWDSPEQIIEVYSKYFKMDKWANQPRRVEVWVEKDALVGVLEKACRPLDVSWFSCRGYTSLSTLYDAGKRLARYADEGQEPLVIHLGDHDPSGIDMTRDITDRVSMFAGQQIDLRRIALSMDQIDEFNPPPNPAKTTDSRFASYQEKYGEDSWELDALTPSYLVEIITNTVTEERDEELWEEALSRESTEQDKLKRVSARWDDVQKFLSKPKKTK